MLPCSCYAIPDREEPGFRKAHNELLSALEEERSSSQIMNLLYKELRENKNNVAKEFLAFVFEECNPQRKVHFADVSYACTPSSAKKIPFNTFSRRLIVNENPTIQEPSEPTEDDSEESCEF